MHKYFIFLHVFISPLTPGRSLLTSKIVCIRQSKRLGMAGSGWLNWKSRFNINSFFKFICPHFHLIFQAIFSLWIVCKNINYLYNLLINYYFDQRNLW